MRRRLRGGARLSGLWLAMALAASCGRGSASLLRVNEVVPSNKLGCADAAGERNDWVELYNGESYQVDLGGYSITDDTASPDKHVFADGLTVASKGVLLLWADHTPDQGPTHLSFKLNAKGEEVVLYDPSRKIIDRISWTLMASDLSLARIPDGTGDFVLCATPTCGALNGSSCGE